MRLIVRSLGKYVIKREIITGNKAGVTVLIPRIDLFPSKKEIPFIMIRRLFPIRLGFVMTIIKSQGQLFKNVGISYHRLYLATDNSMLDYRE